MTKEMICISCPLGCSLSVNYTSSDGVIKQSDITVAGNGCNRGVSYAKDEVTSPRRMITTTVPLQEGGTVPVKTSAAVPKDQIFSVLHKVRGITAARPVSIGQIIVGNVCEGVDIVATDNRE